MSTTLTTEKPESRNKNDPIKKIGNGLISILKIPTQNANKTMLGLNDLLVLAKRLPPDKDVLEARKQLTEAIEAILACGSDKKKRTQLVSEAQKLRDALKKKLEDKRDQVETKERETREKIETEAFGLGPNASREQLRKERQLAQQRRTVLAEKIDALEESLGKQADIFADMQMTPPVQNEVDLQIEIAGLRKHLDEEVLTNSRAHEVTELIMTAAKHVAEAVEKHKEAYDETEKIRSQLANLQYAKDFLLLIQAFKSNDDFAKSVLGSAIERLWGLLATSPIRFAAVRNGWNGVQAEWEKAAKDPATYAGGLKEDKTTELTGNQPGTTGSDDSSNEWQKRFDGEMQEKFKELQAAIQPLGRQTDIFQRRDALLSAIQSEEKLKQACKFLTGVIDREIEAAAEAFKKKLKDYTDLSQTIHNQQELVKKLTFGESVFAADRELVAAMLDSFDEAKPKDTSKPDRQLCLDIDAAIKLGEVLSERQRDLLKMEATAKTFSDARQQLRQDFKKDDRAGKGSLLVDYFPDFRKEKQEALAAIEKDLKTLGARKALDLILELKREVEAKIKAAAGIEKEVGESKAMDFRKYFAVDSGERMINDVEKALVSPALKLLKVDGLFVESEYGKLELNALGSASYDSVQFYAFQAVATALRARPFDLEAFRNKEAIFCKTAPGSYGPIEMKKDHAATADLRKPQLEWKQGQIDGVKERTTKLNARYTLIASRLFRARSGASDANAIKQAELMRKVCKGQVSDFSPEMLNWVDRAFKDRMIEKTLQSKNKTDDNAPLDAIEQELLAAIGLAEARVTAALDRFSTCVDGLELRPEGQKAAKLKELPGLVEKWNRLLEDADSQLRSMAEAIGKYAGEVEDEGYRKALETFEKALAQYADIIAAPTTQLHAAALKLIDTVNLSEQIRRKARETALAAIGTRQTAIQGHPISTLLLTRPYAFGDVCLLPKRMSDQLATLEFTILTAI